MSKNLLQYEEKMWDLFELTKEEMPDLHNAYYGSVKDAVYNEGVLGVKSKRLISLAIGIQGGCKDCIISQTDKSLKAGATIAEIFEVCAVAISMGGTLSWSKVLLVANYLEERGLIKSKS